MTDGITWANSRHPARDDLEKIRALAARALVSIDYDQIATLCEIELTVKRAMQKLSGDKISSPPIAIGDWRYGIDPALTIGKGI